MSKKEAAKIVHDQIYAQFENKGLEVYHTGKLQRY